MYAISLLQLNFYSYHFRFRTMKFLPFCLVFAFLLMTSTVLGESETLRETDKTRHYTSRVYKLYHTYLKDVASKNRFQKYQSKPVIKEHEQPLFQIFKLQVALKRFQVIFLWPIYVQNCIVVYSILNQYSCVAQYTIYSDCFLLPLYFLLTERFIQLFFVSKTVLAILLSEFLVKYNV